MELLNHPDQRVNFVLEEFDSSLVSLHSVVGNMPLALLQQAIFDEFVRNKLVKGRVAGPYEMPPFKLNNLQVSRFGIIPKKHQPGKWCLILNLFSPPGAR